MSQPEPSEKGRATEFLRHTGNSRFVQTNWTMVLRAQSDTEADRRAALEAICQDYWFPLYAFARRSGHDREDAQDLIQEFMAGFVCDGMICRANRAKGKLRTFLLTLLKRFMVDQWRKSVAQKRGGVARKLAIEMDAGEERYVQEPATHITPEALYDRHWAESIINRAMDRLRQDHAIRGTSERFQLLRETIWWSSSEGSYGEIGKAMNLDANAVKQAVKRLRDQYRKALRTEVAATLNDADEEAINAEMAELISILREQSASAM
jgi:RNA polymerase sigma factor (sigma-70 family)